MYSLSQYMYFIFEVLCCNKPFFSIFLCKENHGWLAQIMYERKKGGGGDMYLYFYNPSHIVVNKMSQLIVFQ